MFHYVGEVIDGATSSTSTSDEQALKQFDQDPYVAKLNEYRHDPGYGWIAFAGIVLLVIGALTLILGLTANGNSHLVVSHPRYILGSSHLWGWIGIILGIAEISTGCGVFVKNQLSRWVGVIVLGIVTVFDLLIISTYALRPLTVAPLCIFAVYGLLAMYGLVSHGTKLSNAKGSTQFSF